MRYGPDPVGFGPGPIGFVDDSIGRGPDPMLYESDPSSFGPKFRPYGEPGLEEARLGPKRPPTPPPGPVILGPPPGPLTLGAAAVPLAAAPVRNMT